MIYNDVKELYSRQSHDVERSWNLASRDLRLAILYVPRDFGN